MATIAQLAVSLTANTANFTSRIKTAEKLIVKFGKGIARVAARVAKFGAVMAGAAVAGLVLLTKQAFVTMDTLSKMSDRLGISTEALVGLRRAAELTGVSAEGLNKSLSMFVRRLGEVRQGTGEAKAALEALGISADKLASQTPDQAFRTVADAINQVANAADKSVIAYQLFGRQGQALLNTLALGSKGLDKTQREVTKLGLAFTRLEGKAIEDTNDALLGVKQVFAGLGRTIAIKVAPMIQALADKFVGMVTAGAGARENIAKLATKLAGFVKTVVRATAVMAGFVAGMKIATVVGAAVTAIAGLVRSMRLIVAAQGAIAKAQAIVLALAGPAGWATLAAGAAIAAGSVLAVNAAFDKIEDSAKSLVEAGDGADNLATGLGAAAREAEALADATGKLQASADRIVSSVELPVEKFNRLFDELDDLRARDLISVETYGRAIGKLYKDIADATTTDGQKLLENLRQEIEEFGLAGRELELYRLAQSGVDDEVLKTARGLAEQLDGLEETAKALELAKDNIKEIESKPLVFDAAAVGALTQGTSGAASAIAAFERGGANTTEQLTKEIAIEAKVSSRLLEDIVHVLTRREEKLVTLGTA